MNFSKRYDLFDGELKISSKGSGYVTNELANETYFIKRTFLKGALDGDKVRISINTTFETSGTARVQKILKRKNTYFTSKLYINKKQVFASIYPLQSKKIILKNIDCEIDCGDIFFIKIIDWRENHKLAYAEPISLVAKSDDPISDYILIARRYGIDNFKKYTDTTIDQDKYENILKENIDRRTDLTSLNTFTIDPENAKDFDDAISIQKRNSINELYIHIADVSTFIKENSNNDQRALERGNSYYFNEQTTHMLPEFLSTNICSLVPGKKRLALSLKITLNSDCDVECFSFFDSVIISDRKFHYGEVEKIIHSKKEGSILTEIKKLKLITDKLKKKRLSKDGFNLDNNEIFFELDKKGNPIKSHKLKKLQAHEMIEECMLLANMLASLHINNLQNKLNFFGIYRNHEKVSIKNEIYLKELISFIKMNPINLDSNLKAKDLNSFLNNLDSDQRKAFSQLIVRKMQKARYSTKSLGHYGLGLRSYTHFTSPIRRYSDMVVHRMIKGDFKNNDRIFSIIHCCNDGEVRSQNAERAYKTIKGLKFLQLKQNDSLIGYITKIQRSRIIINEASSGVDGIVLKKYIPKGYYKFDKKMLFMYKKIGLESFRVGQKVDIKVAFIDLISQEAYFKFIN